MKRVSTLFVLLAAAVPLRADVTRFQLAGTVRDATGGVLPGATVALTNTDTGLVQTAVADASGAYTFAPLGPPGRWRLEVRLDGFRGEKREGLRFSANTRPKIEFQLQVSALRDEVTVTSEAPVIETSASELTQGVAGEQVSTLPNDGRSFLSFMELTGSVVNIGGGSGNYSFNGQGRRMADFLSDGTSITGREIRTINGEFGGGNGLSLDTIQEVQVISNGFKAEVGRSGAGAVSVTTKSGTNDFHGSAYTYQKPKDFVAKDQITGRESQIKRQQYGATLSGPLVEDRTHFLANWESGRLTDQAVITSVLAPGSFELPSDTDQAFLKIDHSLNSSHRLDLRLNWNKNNSVGSVGGLNTPDRRQLSEGRTFNAATSLTSSFGSTRINELRARFTLDSVDFYSPLVASSGKESRTPDFSKLQTPAVTRPGVGNTGPNPGLPQNLVENRLQLVDHFTLYRGKHTLKLGADTILSWRFVTFFNNFTGTYSFSTGTPFPYDPANRATFPFQYTQSFGISDLHFKDQMLGLFAQDDWEATPGLTLNLGLRWDWDSLFQGDYNNIAPRVGFAYDIGRNHKTVLRGNFGLFYDTMESSGINRESNFGPEGQISIDLRQGDPLFPQFPQRFNSLPAGASAVPRSTVYIPIFTGTTFPRSIGDRVQRDTPYFLNFSAGVEQQLRPGWSVSADVTRVEGKDLLVTFDANAPAFYALAPGRTRTLAQGDATRPFGSPSRVPGPLGVDFGGYRIHYLQINGGATSYWAVKLGLEKAFTGKFGFQARYTWSKARGDVDNFRNSQSFVPGLRAIDGDRSYQYGISETDVPHIFALNGIYELPWKIRFAATLLARSGRPYTGVAGFDADGDGFNSNGTSYGDRNASLPRNSFRIDPFYNLDLALSKAIPFAGRHQLDVRFEVFNVANRANTLSVNQVMGLDPANPAAGFGTQTTHSTPRSAQLAVRYSF